MISFQLEVSRKKGWVGGGLTADAAKYFASELNLPLVVLPTALSADAFITTASGIRKDGCVYYIETRVPERLILDLKTIAQAPAFIRAAGITDVISIATGAWGWQFAHEKGKNPAPLEKALKACNVPLNNIPQDMIERTLIILPDYSRRHNLPFGIAHTL